MQSFSSRRNQIKPRKKRGKNGNGGYHQKAVGGYSFKPNIGPVRARRIPNEFSVALVNTDYDAFPPSGSYVSRKFGIVEFLSYRPLYCLELYQIYKYARITAVDIELRVVNQSTNTPLIAALGMCPNSDAAGLVPDRAWETPGTVRKLMSVQGGIDKCVLRKTFVGQDAYGQPYLDQKFWIDASQSASTTPVDANEPVGFYMLSSNTGTGPGACTVEFKLTYHIQFFDLRIPSSSLAKTNDEESFMDETKPESRNEIANLKAALIALTNQK